MSALARKGKHSRLTVTMVKGIVLCGLVSVALVMLVIFGLYRPRLQRQTLEQAVSTGHILASQVDVAVRRLREKIEDDPAEPTFIVTRRGQGYLFGG